MRKYGVEIKKFGIGLPIGRPIWTIKVSKTPIAIHPFLLGAYVMASDEKEVDKLTYLQKSEVYASGVMWNILTAGGIGAFLVLEEAPEHLYAFPILVIALLLFFIFSKVASQVVFVGGIAYLTFIILLTVGGEVGIDGFLGPVGVVASITGFDYSFLDTVAYMSILLGITNAMPIPPLDGGHMIAAVLEKIRVPNVVIKAFKVASATVLFSFIVLITINDIIDL